MRQINEPATATHPPPIRGMNPPPKRRAAGFLLFALLLIAPVLSCRHPEREAVATALTVPIDQIARMNPASFERYLKGSPLRTLGVDYTRLMASLPDSIPGFEAREHLLLPRVQSLVECMRDRHHILTAARVLEMYRRSPLEKRVRYAFILRRILVLTSDTRLSLADKARAYEALIEESKSLGDMINQGDLYGPYCEILPRLGRDGDLIQALTRATEAALAFGDTTMACQFLGTLGTHYGHAANESAMTDCWGRALLLARASRSWQEARILGFFAQYHADLGDPAHAVALLAQAEDRCRALKAHESEIRFLHLRLGLFTQLSCWDLVERGLRRADALIRSGARSWPPMDRSIWRARMLTIRMRLAGGRGNADEAVRYAREVATLAAAHPPGPNRERLRLTAARTLAQFRHQAEARTQVERALSSCDSFRVTELIPDCHLQAAALELSAGYSTAADSALARFRRAAKPDPDPGESWIRHDLLAARLAWQRHDRSSALRTLVAALTRLETCSDKLGPSPEAYLILGRFQELRTLFHEMTAGDPRLGYLFELGWSDLRFLRRDAAGEVGPARVARLALRGADPILPELADGSVHCVYSWDDLDVIRWTRTGDVVTRQRLGVTPAALRPRIEAVAEYLAHAERGDAADKAARQELGALARLLLPAELLADDDHRTLLISREGPLARLPFEALSRTLTAYQPLLTQRDVAYLNTVAPAARARGAMSNEAAGSTLVVTDPAYDASLTRRWSVLNESLPASVDEARQFAGASPGASLLRGAEASRTTLLGLWQDARELYLASHCVRNPELSYEAYLPLAGPDEAGSLVTLRDVQNADLSNCRLVVLSGCETGVRYAAGAAEIPSLGDMFLKAGAAAVVQTGWSVRDADGAAVMHRFNTRYASTRRDPVAALGDARREMIRLGFPPNVWAAYTLLINPPAENPAAARTMETAWNRSR